VCVSVETSGDGYAWYSWVGERVQKVKFFRIASVCFLVSGFAQPLSAQDTEENKIEVPQFGSFKSFWNRNDGEKDDSSSGSSSGSSIFGGLFGNGKTHEKFDGKYIATLNSLTVSAPVGITPDQTGLQLARREAIGEHGVPVPLPAIKFYAERVLDRLLRASGVTGVTPNVVIIAEQQIHGHAFPDGTIFLTLGAIRNLKTEDQLAALLSHELSHIVLKHHDSDWFMATQEQGLAALQFGLDLRQQIKKAQGKSADDNSLEDLKIRYLAKGVVFGSQLLIASPFSRAQEDEADLLGVDLLAKANYSINDMDRMMEKLVSQEKQNFEDAKKHKVDQKQAIKDLAAEGKSKGLFKSIVSALDGVFDKITESMTAEFGALHRAAVERRESLDEYLDREYGDAKPVKAEKEQWLAARGTPETKAVLEGYRHVYQARNAINGDDYKTAVAEIRSALRFLGRNHGPALLTAGLIDARAGRTRSAERYLRQSLAAEQPVLSAYAIYAELLRRSNRPKVSGLILSRAVKDLNDPPQLLPDQIEFARVAGPKQKQQTKVKIGALTTRCKLSPLKKLSELCDEAVAGKYTRLQALSRKPEGGGQFVEITGSSLRVRNGPDGKAAILTSVRRGDQLSVLGGQDSWVQIMTENGTVGWVAKGYTRVVGSKIKMLPVKQTIHKARPKNMRPKTFQTQTSAGNDIIGRLKKLKKAHELGLVTDAEFNAKRKELLKLL
jgi:Zn-dependent protease with chaperone function